jgi:hypothetical protein
MLGVLNFVQSAQVQIERAERTAAAAAAAAAVIGSYGMR